MAAQAPWKSDARLECENSLRDIICAYGSTDANSEVNLARCIKRAIQIGRAQGFIEEKKLDKQIKSL